VSESGTVESERAVEDGGEGSDLGFIDEGESQRVAWVEYNDDAFEAVLMTKTVGALDVRTVGNQDALNGFSLARVGGTSWVARTDFSDGPMLSDLRGQEVPLVEYETFAVQLVSMGTDLLVGYKGYVYPGGVALLGQDLSPIGTQPLDKAVDVATPIGPDHVLRQTVVFEGEDALPEDREFAWQPLNVRGLP